MSMTWTPGVWPADMGLILARLCYATISEDWGSLGEKTLMANRASSQQRRLQAAALRSLESCPSSSASSAFVVDRVRASCASMRAAQRQAEILESVEKPAEEMPDEQADAWEGQPIAGFEPQDGSWTFGMHQDAGTPLVEAGLGLSRRQDLLERLVRLRRA